MRIGKDMLEVETRVPGWALALWLVGTAIYGVVAWTALPQPIDTIGIAVIALPVAAVTIAVPLAWRERRVRIDASRRRVDVFTRTLFGSRLRAYPFEDLRDVVVGDRLCQRRHSPVFHEYSLALETRDVEIRLLVTLDVQEQARVLAAVRRLTGLESRAVQIVRERLRRRS